ncbi:MULTISPECIES: hypothetical protein [Mycobacterium]|uniref:Uncharacterized protein n=2 Tax=Mycobacterium TaxID=1763 RepID=A0A1W9ZJD7_MYCAN|nr:MULTISPECIES: hypothetical protein [Mycobacterium]MCV7076140.1 hypothetical protein [Mycobacterium szulgai]MCV7198258.1 hypothetical protein [Mycobacterium angelicum]ORA16637.1 hypothetical protein BST12_20385 [Mycobacterium angelicum]ORW92352.1 hypothetical protein AWC27_08845 [Mycobacterium szulgai]
MALAFMKLMTAKVSAALDACLRHEAQQSKLIISAITREALEPCCSGAEHTIATEVGSQPRLWSMRLGECRLPG